MLSISSERPLDHAVVAILRTVQEIAGARGITYIVVGATARDILLTHVHGLPASRATRDVDFAVAVESWLQFDEIRSELARRPGFQMVGDVPHRLYYQPNDEPAYPLDLVPFGGVATANQIVRWPPDMKILMNVAGYAEVAATAERVNVADDLVVNVASLPGLALLKLFAWHDRAPGNTKDAEDLLTLMRNYTEAGNRDRVFELDETVFAELGYDLDDAGVLLLGVDIARLANPATLAQCIEILDEPKLLDRLSIHMARTRASVEEGKALADRSLALLVRGLRT